MSERILTDAQLETIERSADEHCIPSLKAVCLEVRRLRGVLGEIRRVEMKSQRIYEHANALDEIAAILAKAEGSPPSGK